MASLSHEAYNVAWHATFWAEQNLRYAAFKPSVLDWDVVIYLDDISWNVPWIARKIEQNPATPRVASKFTYDMVAYDAMILRLRYQPTSFRQSTCAQIEPLERPGCCGKMKLYKAWAIQMRRRSAVSDVASAARTR
jgi:hypothetical protein